MSDGIFKRVLKALNARVSPDMLYASAEKRLEEAERRAREELRSSVEQLEHDRKERPAAASRVVFVYRPETGPAQTMTRFALFGASVEVSRQRFGETRQSVREVFDSAEIAKTALERMVAELCATGHKAAESERAAFTALIVHSPELEEALVKNPTDAMLQVYGDYKLERGDLHGELIQLMIRKKSTEAWLKKNEPVLFGPAWHRRSSFRHRWSRGFISELDLVQTSLTLAEPLIRDLFALPAMMLLNEIVVPADFQPLIASLMRPPSLKRVTSRRRWRRR